MHCPYRGKNPTHWQLGSVQIAFPSRLHSDCGVDVRTLARLACFNAGRKFTDCCQKEEIKKHDTGQKSVRRRSVGK